jgi:hypothetical protein
MGKDMYPDRHQNGKSDPDPDRHYNDTDPQRTTTLADAVLYIYAVTYSWRRIAYTPACHSYEL